MHRVDNATSADLLPTPQPVGPNPDGYFQPQTIVDADWANAIQEEICNVITGEGISLNKFDRNQLGSAIKIMLRGQFAAHQADPPNMTVLIDAGRIMYNGELIINAQQAASIITADPTNPRIDRVLISKDTGLYFVTAGTPAASPAAPAIPAGFVSICQVYIPALATVITNSQIADERILMESSSIAHARIATNATAVIGGSGTSLVTISNAEFPSAPSFDTAGLFSPSNPGRLTVPSGYYFADITANGGFLADDQGGSLNGTATLCVLKNGSVIARQSTTGDSSIVTIFGVSASVSTGRIAVAAGDYFQIGTLDFLSGVSGRLQAGASLSIALY